MQKTPYYTFFACDEKTLREIFGKSICDCYTARRSSGCDVITKKKTVEVVVGIVFFCCCTLLSLLFFKCFMRGGKMLWVIYIEGKGFFFNDEKFIYIARATCSLLRVEDFYCNKCYRMIW